MNWNCVCDLRRSRKVYSDNRAVIAVGGRMCDYTGLWLGGFSANVGVGEILSSDRAMQMFSDWLHI